MSLGVLFLLYFATIFFHFVNYTNMPEWLFYFNSNQAF